MRLRDKFRRGLDWPTVVWISGVHLMCVILAAWYFFTWQGFVLFLGLGITTGLSVTLGYHRYFTHGSFKTYPPVELLLTFIGQLAGEGSALHWVANHRMHHRKSDKEGDPHSPHEFAGALGFLWAHLLWMLPKMSREERAILHARWAPDLLHKRLFRFLDRTYVWWHVALGSGIFVTGWLVWDLYTGTSLLTWGMFVRIAFVFHSTWLVNSATHRWGYRNYETSDRSTNSLWVALLTFGEGWHNNHHADQLAANHGVRWYEKLLDPTYQMICLLEKLRLVWDVKRNRFSPK
jgi:stearoyl-CoA desaturase (delta-9 desaturase)